MRWRTVRMASSTMKQAPLDTIQNAHASDIVTIRSNGLLVANSMNHACAQALAILVV